MMMFKGGQRPPSVLKENPVIDTEVMDKCFELMLHTRRYVTVHEDCLVYTFSEDQLGFMPGYATYEATGGGEPMKYDLLINIYYTGQVKLEADYGGETIKTSKMYRLDKITVPDIVKWVHSFDWDKLLSLS